MTNHVIASSDQKGDSFASRASAPLRLPDFSLLPDPRDCRGFAPDFFAFEAPVERCDLRAGVLPRVAALAVVFVLEALLRVEALLFVPAVRDFDRAEPDLLLPEAVFERLALAPDLVLFAFVRPAEDDFFRAVAVPVLALLRVPVRLLLRALARDPLLLRDVRPRADLPPDPASRSIMPGAPEADSVSSVSSAMFSVSRLPDPVFRAIASFLHSRAQWNETPEA